MAAIITVRFPMIIIPAQRRLPMIISVQRRRVTRIAAQTAIRITIVLQILLRILITVPRKKRRRRTLEIMRLSPGCSYWRRERAVLRSSLNGNVAPAGKYNPPNGIKDAIITEQPESSISGCSKFLFYFIVRGGTSKSDSDVIPLQFSSQPAAPTSG